MKFVLDDSVGFIISRTASKMKNCLHQNFKPYDITTEQWGLLNRLWEKDGVSQKVLSEKSFKDQPNITRILDKLEDKGFIRREVDPDDRRAFLIFLTKEGRELKNILIPVVKETLEVALKGFKTEEVEQLKNLLNRIYFNFD